MKHQTTFYSWFSALGLILLLGSSNTFSRPGGDKSGAPDLPTDAPNFGDFIAAFDWSVEQSHNRVWPFESQPPAPFQSVWVVVETMPRAWREKRRGKNLVSLSAQRCLQVNGRPLPKPERARNSQTEFRVSLDRGRLRFSFSPPSGFRLQPRYALIRIKLYQSNKPSSQQLLPKWFYHSRQSKT